MNAKISHPVERDAQWVQAYRDELVERITQAVREDGTVEPLQGVRLHRSSLPNEPIHSVAEPHFAVIAQGSKEIYLGDERYRFDPYHYCLGTVGLPVASRIVEASKERPYLSFRLELDPILIGSVMSDAGLSAPPNYTDVNALGASTLDADLLDAVVRLVRLIESPAEAQVLAPLVKREIFYRLLMGNLGAQLRHIAIVSGYTPPIARAIEHLRKDFDQPLRIESIASGLGPPSHGWQWTRRSKCGLPRRLSQRRTL
jgi:hypothetical protein